MVTTKPKLKGPPPEMEVPSEIELKRSGVDPERIGIWCKSHIPCGRKFGPFMGNKVQEATDDMDPTYVWEIVDLDTKEFLFYIDATNEKEGNWMRYINCARFFEEQNIVSEQEGVDIIYRAIKDIYPEQELLTWYEKAPLRKRKGRRIKRAPKAKVTDLPEDLLTLSKTSSAETVSAGTSESSKGTNDTESNTGMDFTRKADGDTSELHVSQRGRRCKVTKYWEMEADFSEDDEDKNYGEMSGAGDDGKKAEHLHAAQKLMPEDDEDWIATRDDPETHHKSVQHLSADLLGELSKDPREYYQFEMKPCYVVKSRVGRKLFKCDICSSVYRHSFSLKRHYVRNHLNYRYISPTDLINCCVPLKSIPTAITIELRKSMKCDFSNDSLSTSTQKDVSDLASEENDADKCVHDESLSVPTDSPLMESMGSLNRDELVNDEKRLLSKEPSLCSNGSSVNDDMKDICEEVRDAADASSSDKLDCYDGDTEIEQDISDSEPENITDDLAKDKENDSIVSNTSGSKVIEGEGIPELVNSDSNCKHVDFDTKTSNQIQIKGDISGEVGERNVASACCAMTGDKNGLEADAVECEKVNIEKSDSDCLFDAEAGDPKQDGASVAVVSQPYSSHKTVCDGVSTVDKCASDKSETSLCDDQCEDVQPELGREMGEMKSDNKEKEIPCDSEVKLNEAGGESAHLDVPLNGKGEPMYGLFRCNICEKVFDTISDLREHLANHPDVTDGRQTFACEKCEMKFAHKQNLMRHQAVHTGMRPYICSCCDKKFPTSTNLRRHEKIHQARKFSCPHCHTVFTQTGDLKKHVHEKHPEVFHECGFCTRYFVKKRLLLDHLRETHDGKTADENFVEIESKQETLRFDLHLDRAESMRLAITHGRNKPGPRFACTVCRKRFHDYTSMCRHRRLAHQRPIFVPPITDENGDIIDDAVQHYTNPCKHGFYDPEDEEQAVFYASIANVIADNLQNCIEGKEEHLKEVSPLVKWKNKNSTINSKNETDAKSAKVIADSIVYSLQEFNFPKDFKLKSSSNCYRAVPYSSDGRISWKNKKSMSERKRTESMNDQSQEKVRPDEMGISQSSLGASSALLQFLQNDITSMPQTMTSTSILARAELNTMRSADSSLPPLPPLHRCPKSEVNAVSQSLEKCPKLMPIRVPQVKSCKICRCLFHNNSLYQQHMSYKHGITIGDDQVGIPKSQSSSGHCRNQPELARPGQVYSGATCLTGSRSDKQMPDVSDGPALCPPAIPIKTEPLWDEPPLLTEEGKDINGASQVVNDMADLPCNPDLTDDPQPLDLSKKSHLAGYKLTNKDDDSQVDPGSDKPSSKGHSEEIEANSDMKCQSDGAKFICGACRGRYGTYDELLTHQEADHPNVVCTYSQLDEEVARSLLTTPNPIGILNVCSTQLPPVTASPKRTNRLSCTKCSKTFQCMADLHSHIANCAEPYVPKMMFVYYYPGTKNRHFFLPGAKGEMVKVKKGQKYRRNGTDALPKKTSNTSANVTQDIKTNPTASEDSQNAFLKHKEDYLDDLEGDQMQNIKKKRRRNYELLYNPHKHIRRREMAEIIDTPKCFGCNGSFSTISLLERHIPLCRHKDKIQDQAVSKEGEQQGEQEENEDNENFYDPNKHMCIYCQKQFTYFGMLRKHVFDVCPVRGDLVEKGEYIDEEWEREIRIRAGQPNGVQSRGLSRQSSVSSLNGMVQMENGDTSTSSKGNARGRRRRRGNGWYRGKDKKKDSGVAGEWERYFVLDETFMGIYNTVARTDDDDEEEGDEEDDKDADRSSWTDTGDLTGDNSMASKTSGSRDKTNEYSQQSATWRNRQREYLEEMQHKKQALFAELIKPIDNKDSVEKESLSLLDVKSHDANVAAKNAVKREGEQSDKQPKSEEAAEKPQLTKKDSVQKMKTKVSSADSLANVKQKLAKKIRENKKLHGNNASVHDGRLPFKLVKSDKTMKYSKKSPKKGSVETHTGLAKGSQVKSAIVANESTKTKSPLKLSVSGRKPAERVHSFKTKQCQVEGKAQDISGIHKVKKFKPKLGKLCKSGSGSEPINEEFCTLGEIVSRYTKGRSKSPKMWLGRPSKKKLEEVFENFEDHRTVNEVIDAVAKGVEESKSTKKSSIKLIDSSDEDEDNMKLSELRAKGDDCTRSISDMVCENTLAESSKKAPVKSNSTTGVIGMKGKAKGTVKLFRRNQDNFSHSFARYKSPKRLYKKNNVRITKSSRDAVHAKVDVANGKKIKGTDVCHVRSKSDPVTSVGEANKKLKECSMKRSRSLESVGPVGKKMKCEVSKENSDTKATPKKAKCGKVL